MMRHISLWSVLAFAFVLVMPVQAQETEQELTLTQEEREEFVAEIAAWSVAEPVDTGVDCFDHYKFQSVQVSLGAMENTYEEGTSVEFSGYLKNDNDYPIVDGNVYVRIGQFNENYQSEGNYIVDEFFALESITLKENEKKDVTFTWPMPEDLTEGSYQVDFFFSVGKKFNLGGLPFSNDIKVGIASFDVTSEEQHFISFDRTKTSVNGESYQHVGNWPTFDSGKEVTITNPIISTFPTAKEVTITYDLYYWDSLDKGDLIDTKTQTMTIAGNSAQNVSYTIPSMDESVYYLTMTAEVDGQRSIMNVRVTSDNDRPRLNYPAITKFPLTIGDHVTLFSCFHNTTDSTTQGKMIVTLEDEENNIISTIDYEGDIPSAMSADATEFIAQENYNFLVLSARLFDKDAQLVDEYTVMYDCNDFGNCAEGSTVRQNDTKKNIFAPAMLAIIFIPLLILVVALLVRKLKKNRHK